MYNVVSLDTMETNNNFVCVFTQNTLEIQTNLSANLRKTLFHVLKVSNGVQICTHPC